MVRRRRNPTLTTDELELVPFGVGRAAGLRIRGRWQEIRRLRVASYDRGGVTVDEPPRAPEGVPLLARSVIQPDGDVLFFVSEELAADAARAQAHVSTVLQWYQDAAGSLRTIGASLLAVRWTGAGALAISSGTWTAAWTAWWSTAFAVLVAGVALPVLRWLTGLLLRRTLTARLLS